MAATTTLSYWRMAIILSFTVTLFALIVDLHSAFAAGDGSKKSDMFLRRNLGTVSRHLAGTKGETCTNSCTGALSCCSSKCRDMTTDRNNCGSCGNNCGFGSLCCGAKCAQVAYDVKNCGGCGVTCKEGEKCEYGNCGYA